MFAILNQVQGYDCSLANAEKLKIVQLPSETQRSVTWVEEFYCACSLFAGRWFPLGFALMKTGLKSRRNMGALHICRSEEYRYEASLLAAFIINEMLKVNCLSAKQDLSVFNSKQRVKIFYIS